MPTAARHVLSYFAVAAIALTQGAAHAASETALHSFGGASDGYFPVGALTKLGGMVYGVTLQGGYNGCVGVCGCGAVYSVDETGAERVVYEFKGESGVGGDGSQPQASLVQVGEILYGVTSGGGNAGCVYGYGCGTVYSVTPDGSETVLYAFKGGADGYSPRAGLINVRSSPRHGALGRKRPTPPGRASWAL